MIKTFTLFTALFFSSLNFAANGNTSKDIQTVTANLKKVIPMLKVDSITPTPLAGVYELVSNNKVYYISKDARYLINGTLIDIIDDKNLTNATLAKLEEKNKVVRVEQLKTIKKEDFLIYPAKGETKHVMSVFTDVSCPFCTKLHQEIDELNDNGVEVRYMFFPRDYSRVGNRSRSFQAMVSVWCADDQKQALTDSKNREEIESKSCDHPLLSHIELAKSMGLSGTPMMILDDGTLFEGFRPASALLKAFN